MAGLVARMGAGAGHRAGLHACRSRRVRGRAGDARTRVANTDTAVPVGVQQMLKRKEHHLVWDNLPY
jgi:hypothetical protein